MSRDRLTNVTWGTYLFILMTLLPVQLVVAGNMNLIITLDRADLQRRVERLFPVVREDPWISVQLHHPAVILREGSDRIGLRLQMETTAGPQFAMSGVAQVEGKLRFERKAGEFYLDDARMTELVLAGVEQPFVEQIRQVAEVVVRQALQVHPVYALNQTAEAKRFMGSEIKAVTVDDGKLVIELAMP